MLATKMSTETVTTASAGSLPKSNLMSPPQPSYLDPFQGSQSPKACSSHKLTVPDEQFPSPPVTPNLRNAVPAPIEPTMFPSDSQALFPTMDSYSDTNEDSTNETPSPTSTDSFESVPSTLSSGSAAILFQAALVYSYSKDPCRWLQDNVAQLRADRQAWILARSKPAISSQTGCTGVRHIRRSSASLRQPSTQTRAQFRASPVLQPAKASTRVPKKTFKAANASLKLHRHVRPVVPQSLDNASTIKEPKASPPADSLKQKSRPRTSDKDFELLEDVSPSVQPDESLHFRISYSSRPLDLSDDVHSRFLHKDELGLASMLRLDCATYLTSKRRIFLERRAFHQKGQLFLKTHAQKVCYIDVNKVSKMWEAFNNVGWFDEKWM